MKKILQPSSKDLKEFGILISFALPIIVGFILPAFANEGFRVWTLYICLPTLFISFIFPKLLTPVYLIWMRSGDFLGWINSRIILGLVFLIVLQPIAFVMRVFKYNPLRKEWSKKQVSYREHRESDTINLNKIF
tara:strand:+ start:437 stop:838 length:402 start_codon:yes stop_codon:yes gene_type:complete